MVKNIHPNKNSQWSISQRDSFNKTMLDPEYIHPNKNKPHSVDRISANSLRRSIPVSINGLLYMSCRLAYLDLVKIDENITQKKINKRVNSTSVKWVDWFFLRT